MTFEEIASMVESQGVYEIVYLKDNTERIWHISNIESLKEYNNKCIVAYCHELKKDLTLAIKSILSAKRYWIDIFDESNTAEDGGLYVLACLEDNYVGRRVAYINRGERFCKYGDVLAYHLVPGFCIDNNSGWKSKEQEVLRNSISLYVFRGNADGKGCVGFSLVISEDGNNYYLLDTGAALSLDRLIEEDNNGQISIIGRYDVSIYDERNLGSRSRVKAKLLK